VTAAVFFSLENISLDVGRNNAPLPPTYVKGGKQTRHTMAGVFNISEGSEHT